MADSKDLDIYLDVQFAQHIKNRQYLFVWTELHQLEAPVTCGKAADKSDTHLVLCDITKVRSCLDTMLLKL
ncbi:hypothetical protein NXS19_009026 [Fusarium pseudograminearum]|nr:hypothetical protein NXS19_009026 [Fusarium pseudograminearum]